MIISKEYFSTFRSEPFQLVVGLATFRCNLVHTYFRSVWQTIIWRFSFLIGIIFFSRRTLIVLYLGVAELAPCGLCQLPTCRTLTHRGKFLQWSDLDYLTLGTSFMHTVKPIIAYPSLPNVCRYFVEEQICMVPVYIHTTEMALRTEDKNAFCRTVET